MEANSVSFGANPAPKQQKGKGILSAVAGSVVNVGGTMAIGAGVGALGGKVASLVPYKPNEGALMHQYQDMFIRAVRSSETPEYLERAGLGAEHLAANALAVSRQKMSETHGTIEGILELIQRNRFDVNQKEAQELLLEVLPEGMPTVADGESLIGKVTQKLIDKRKEIQESFDATNETWINTKTSFIESLKNSTDAGVKDIAEKGAKHLRKSAIVGAGIGIGVIVALVLNILKTNGVIGKKKPKQQDVQTR